MYSEFWEPLLWGPNNCELSIFLFVPFLLAVSWEKSIQINPEGMLPFCKISTSQLWVFSTMSIQLGGQRPQIFFLFSRGRPFFSLALLLPTQGTASNPVVNRPFLRSGSPEWRESLFVACSVNIKGQCSASKGRQGLRKLLSPLCRSKLLHSPTLCKKPNASPGEGGRVGSQGSGNFLLFPVGHPSQPE